MKLNIVATVVLLGFGSSPLFAACPAGAWITGTAIKDLVSGKYACAFRGSEKWNEKHLGTGLGPSDFEDYKLGPGPSIDPTKTMGQYTITDNGATSPGTITYRYGNAPAFAGGTYTYQVRAASSGIGGISYFYCNVDTAEIIAVTIRPDPTPC